ncbi:NAD(P)-dependent oxidoreductase [Microbacterium terregens]|uniref:NAD(P)-dependent oxidoreductase n=1 Tax=Microbacterium terregens TaxID=69363 RepID=A0ABV5T4V9_9MICO
MTNVTVIGLGAMGLPMALHLGRSFPVKVYDIDPVAVDSATQGGATRAGTLRDAGSGADVVVLVVRDAGQLEEALFGSDALAPSLAPGAVVVITSTVGEQALLSSAARLAERDILCVDAALSGGPVRAGTGELLVMVGGSPKARAAAHGVLDALASTLCIVGDQVGQGQQLKVVNQLLCGIHTAAAAEALALAHSFGLDLDMVIDVLGAGAAASFMLADRGPRIAQRIRGEEPPLRSRLDVIGKDMGIVGDATRAHKVAAPVAAAAEQLYRIGEAAGLAAEDDSIIAMILAGVRG